MLKDLDDGFVEPEVVCGDLLTVMEEASVRDSSTCLNQMNYRN